MRVFFMTFSLLVFEGIAMDYKALGSERDHKELIAVWGEFFKKTTWQNMITGCEPIFNGNGVVYETLNFLGRPCESCAIVDMRSISISEPHYHPEVEIYFILQGSCTAVIGCQPFLCLTGSIISVPADVAHFIIPDDQCVVAVINTPPFNRDHYHALIASNPGVQFDYEQFCTLKAAVSQEMLQKKYPTLVAVWGEFFKDKTWQELVQGCSPLECRNGVCYKMGNPLGRINEDCTVLDMRAIDISEPHYHVEAVVYFVLQGEGIVVAANKEYPCKKGDTIFIPSNVSHYVIPNDDCVLAIVSTPPSNVDNYRPLMQTDLAHDFDHEHFCTLKETLGKM